MTTNGTQSTNGHSAHPKIHLYTNHGCPFAHRAHIALAELDLPFEETILDLSVPRPQWYLDINPRGLVPSIKYSVPGLFDEEIITESAIVSQFLADLFPGPLLPASKESPSSALKRARVNFFVDTWGTKVMSFQYQVLQASSEDKEEKSDAWFKAIEKEIEPLLADAAPFFGGSKEITLAEVIAAPFVVRYKDFAADGVLVPKSFGEKLAKLPNYSKWAKAIGEKETVTRIYDGADIVEKTKGRMEKLKAAK